MPSPAYDVRRLLLNCFEIDPMLSLLAAVCLIPAQAEPFDASAAADGLIAAITPDIAEPDKPFRMLVTFEVVAEHEQDFLDLFQMATKKTRQESGNLTYHMSKVVDTDAEDGANPTYVLFETWKNLDALDQHLRTDYLVEVLTKLEMYTASVELQIMEPKLTREHRKIRPGAAGNAPAGKGKGGKGRKKDAA